MSGPAIPKLAAGFAYRGASGQPQALSADQVRLLRSVSVTNVAQLCGLVDSDPAATAQFLGLSPLDAAALRNAAWKEVPAVVRAEMDHQRDKTYPLAGQ